MDLFTFLLTVIYLPILFTNTLGFRVIGLTGGIATGKSTTSRYLRQLGIPVIDFDVIAREVVQPGSSTLKTIEKEFGADLVLPDGQLNRPKLSEIIFNDPSKRKRLNAIMQRPILFRFIVLMVQFFIVGLTQTFVRNPSTAYHGVMTDKIYPGLQQFLSGSRVIVLDCPLLFESGISMICSHVLYVDTDIDVQIHRLMARDNITEDVAQKRMNAQYHRDQKLKLSTSVIVNNSTKEQLFNNIVDWWIKTTRSFGIQLPQPYSYSKIKHIIDPETPPVTPQSQTASSSDNTNDGSHEHGSHENKKPGHHNSAKDNNSPTHYVPRTTLSNYKIKDVINESTTPSYLEYYSPLNWCIIPNIASLIVTGFITIPAFFVLNIVEPMVFGSDAVKEKASTAVQGATEAVSKTKAGISGIASALGSKKR